MIFLFFPFLYCQKKYFFSCDEAGEVPHGYERIKEDPDSHEISLIPDFDGKTQLKISNCTKELSINAENTSDLEIESEKQNKNILIFKKNMKSLKIRNTIFSFHNVTERSIENVTLQNSSTSSLFPKTSFLNCEFESLKGIDQQVFETIDNVIIHTSKAGMDINVYILFFDYQVISESEKFNFTCSSKITVVVEHNDTSVFVMSSRWDIPWSVKNMSSPYLVFTKDSFNATLRVNAFNNTGFLIIPSKISNAYVDSPKFYGSLDILSELYNCSDMNFSVVDIDEGKYCVSDETSYHLCDKTMKIIYHDKKQEGIDYLVSNSNDRIELFAVCTTDENIPVISSKCLNNKKFYVSGLSKSEQKCEVAIYHIAKDVEIDILNVSDIKLSIVAIDSLNANWVQLKKCVLPNAERLKPLSSITFDEASSDWFPAFRGIIPQIEYYAQAHKIVFEKNKITVYGKNVVTFNAAMYRDFGILTSCSEVVFQCTSEEDGKLNYQNVIIVTDTEDPNSKIIFDRTWDKYKKLSIDNKINIANRNANIESLVPTWPSAIFQFDGNITLSDGGKYCIYDKDSSPCPPDFLPVQNEEVNYTNFYKNAKTNDTQVFIVKPISISAKINLMHSRFIGHLDITIRGSGTVNYIMDCTDALFSIIKVYNVVLRFSKMQEDFNTFSAYGLYLYGFATLERSINLCFHDFYAENLRLLTTIASKFIHPERMNITLCFDNTVDELILAPQSFQCKKVNDDLIDVQKQFKICNIIFMESLYRAPIKVSIHNSTNTTSQLSNITSNASSIVFDFTVSCYQIDLDNKIFITALDGKNMSFTSTISHAPFNAFSIPNESAAIHYAFPPPQTEKPTDLPKKKNQNSVYIIVIVVACVIAVVVIPILCVNMALKKKTIDSVPGDFLMTTTPDFL